ncbi:MAG TPA: hypothetical protein PKH15_08980 [Bacteroidales bacterium]|jgi:hypothetical protein|nr:hypothetical protein [Bacteroidales bacterium]HOD88228.1 hypothetical protein [Bacteroidales bacterium]
MKLLIRTGTLIFCILLIFIKIADAQHDNTSYDMLTSNEELNALLTDEKLTDVKSRLFLTGVRNDTLFIVQYFSSENKIFLIPIAHLNDTSTLFCVRSGNYKTSGNESCTISQLLETDGNTYKILQKMPCPQKEQITNEDKMQTVDVGEIGYLSRILKYTKSKGVVDVEYLPFDKNLCTGCMKWFATEGKFVY